jgi:nickel/cobalt exporter
VLGALHGSELGHSKTIDGGLHYRRPRGHSTSGAIGFAATVSRTFVVWVVALIGMHSGSRYYCAVAEPYFQMATTHTRPPMS